MAGIDEILNIISSQQQQIGESLISAAENKARQISAEGDEKAAAAYEEHMKKYEERLARDLENACSSVDAEMKRRILSCKVECIDAAVEKTIAKLKALPDNEYFSLLEKLAERTIRSGDGVLALGENDLKRAPADLEKRLSAIAAEKNGTIKLSPEAADIPDGFILTYGLISENCSFRAIVEAEKEAVRDVAAKALFGQVS